ncbi:MAG TPA: MarR family transcriptional regulator [Desulfuromonadaceae bacterium]|jgi:DNA-binding MarR family transcriptional regulator
MFDIEQSLGFGFYKVSQRISAIFKEEFREYGITQGQFILLATLWKADGLSQVDLSKKTKIDRTTTGGIIDRLEKAELLKRTRTPEDRRAHLIYLTDKGSSLQQDLCRAAYRVRNRVVEQILPGDYIQLKQLINKLLPLDAEGGCCA